MFFSLFADRLLFFADFCDFFGKLEGLRDYLSQCFFMEVGFFGQFEIIVGNTLLEDSGNLLENFRKIFFKLRSKAFKELLNFLFDFLAIDFFKIIFYLRVDATNNFLKVADSLLKLIELNHNFFEFDID